jgi:hypothetical protein
MLRFQKAARAPAALAAAQAEVNRVRKDAGSAPRDRWNDCITTAQKDEVKLALIKDQGGLCAYCGRGISPETATIEHWEPRSAAPQRTFDWRNLLAVCEGDRGLAEGDTACCDKARAEYVQGTAARPAAGLLVHVPHELPTTHPYLYRVQFNSKPRRGQPKGVVVDGTLTERAPPACPVHTGGCACAGNDLCELNLNAPQLVRARAKVLDLLRSELREAGDRGAPALIERRLNALKKGARRPELWFVEADYLRAKARRHGLKVSPP